VLSGFECAGPFSSKDTISSGLEVSKGPVTEIELAIGLNGQPDIGCPSSPKHSSSSGWGLLNGPVTEIELATSTSDLDC
jgi:hypothetical protein